MKTGECSRSAVGSEWSALIFEEMCAQTHDDRSWADQVEEEEAQSAAEAKAAEEARRQLYMRDCGVYGQCDAGSPFFDAWQDLQIAQKAAELLCRTTRFLHSAEDGAEVRKARHYHADALSTAKTKREALAEHISTFRCSARDEHALRLLRDMEACVAVLTPREAAKKQQPIKAKRDVAQIRREFVQVRTQYLEACDLPETNRSKSIKCRALKQRQDRLRSELMECARCVPLYILTHIETKAQKDADALKFDEEMQEEFGASYQPQRKIWSMVGGCAVQVGVVPKAPCASPVESDDGAGTSSSVWRHMDFAQFERTCADKMKKVEGDATDVPESCEDRDEATEWPPESTDALNARLVTEVIVLDVCSPASSLSSSPESTEGTL